MYLLALNYLARTLIRASKLRSRSTTDLSANQLEDNIDGPKNASGNPMEDVGQI